MCGQRGKTGTLKGKDALEENSTIISVERYKELTREVKGKAQIFYMWGGEPFLYPNFIELARFMSNEIPFFSVNTNGTFLKENAEAIVRDKWKGILISLDGFEDVNDKIRGKGSYRRVIEGIDAINAEKKKRNSDLPYMAVVTTISNQNYLYLADLVKALKGKGLCTHAINLGTYISEKIGQEHSAYVKEKLDTDWPHWKGFANGYNEGIDGEKFKKILQEAHAFNNDHPVLTIPVINPDKIGLYYSELDTPVRDYCKAPWFSVNINYNGDVHFCADYPDYVIGNIKDNSLMEIMNSEKARKFRKVLRESPRGLLPACKRCYQIMIFGHRCM